MNWSAARTRIPVVSVSCCTCAFYFSSVDLFSPIFNKMHSFQYLFFMNCNYIFQYTNDPERGIPQNHRTAATHDRTCSYSTIPQPRRHFVAFFNERIRQATLLPQDRPRGPSHPPREMTPRKARLQPAAPLPPRKYEVPKHTSPAARRYSSNPIRSGRTQVCFPGRRDSF